MDHLQRYREIIPDFDGFLSILDRPLPASVRINTLKTSKSSLLDRLDRSGVAYTSLDWYPLGLRLNVERPGKMIEHLLGHIHIQEEVSMVPPIVLDPQPGNRVLDLCAAPGSKTTQISQATENRGLVIANEPSLARVTSLRSNCERLGAVNVAITRYDGRKFPPQQFDRVLVDAPCSSEGMARKDPRVLSRCSLKRSLDLQVLQIGLLKRAVQLTRSGGVIVYSSCTYAPEENEAVVDDVLGEYRGTVSLEKASVPGLKGCSGLTEWNGTEFCDELKHCARYYPHQNDTGGFFVAKLAKK
jgi:NOL1/NOP2/sun family putative RNA methylase